MAQKVEIEKSALEQLVGFFDSIEAADAIYKPCQDKNFRQHVKACLSAVRMEIAVRTAKELLGKEGSGHEG